MTIAAAHQLGPAADAVLTAAARQAGQAGEKLVVLNLVTAIDLDSQEAENRGIADRVNAILTREGLTADVEVRTEATTSKAIGDVAEGILKAAVAVGASMLVIGARRRSPVGKAFLGSVTQAILLEAPLPVLVVKARLSLPAVAEEPHQSC